MADLGAFGTFVSKANPFGGGLGGMNMFWIVAGLLAFVIVAGTIMIVIRNKFRWNIKVNFKLPRGVVSLREGEKIDISNIQGTILHEVGKAYYDSKMGVVWLKRKWKKKVPMKPFNLSKYLQGTNVIDVVQVGVNEFLPIYPQSFLLFEDDETGEDFTILDLKTDHSQDNAWAIEFERSTKNAYSVSSALEALLKSPIFLVGLVIFLWGIQFLLLYTKIK